MESHNFDSNGVLVARAPRNSYIHPDPEWSHSKPNKDIQVLLGPYTVRSLEV